MFERLKKGIGDIVRKVLETELKAEDLMPIMEELKLILLENDVALSVSDEICRRLEEKLEGTKIGRFEDKEKLARKALRDVLAEILDMGEKVDVLEIVESKRRANVPAIFVFVGFNGTGKTTTLAKLAKFLFDHNYSAVLACSDTFRAGAVEQLEEHARRLGVPMIKRPYGADAASVAFDAINYAKSHRSDAVLIDTAGRAETDRNLMEEMSKIIRISSPDLVIFVGDALAGNAAVDQAENFNKFVRIDSSILTKIDADARGGAALSIAFVTKKPIIFLGNGQRYEDLIPFDPSFIIDKIIPSD